jgi:hypothetical protein
MDNKIQTYPLEEVGANQKGYTYAFKDLIDNRGMLTATRYAGSISGKHYHKGLADEKNPEILVLIAGQAKLFAENLESGDQEEWLFNQPSVIYIYPWIWHELEAYTTCHFIELNTLESHEKDTFYTYPSQKA